MEKVVIVKIQIEEDNPEKRNVSIGFLSKEEMLPLGETLAYLLDAVALAIKTSSSIGGYKDHELMTQVIKYLNDHFGSINSFSDASPSKLFKDISEKN